MTKKKTEHLCPSATPPIYYRPDIYTLFNVYRAFFSDPYEKFWQFFQNFFCVSNGHVFTCNSCTGVRSKYSWLLRGCGPSYRQEWKVHIDWYFHCCSPCCRKSQTTNLSITDLYICFVFLAVTISIHMPDQASSA